MGSPDEPSAGDAGEVEEPDLVHWTGSLISFAALRLHAEALLASFETGEAGFVPDTYLCSVAPDPDATAAPVAELCSAGLWARADDGYRVVSSEALRMAREVHRQMRAQGS